MIPFLIAGAVGFGIAKLLEEDTKKFADGGETKYWKFFDVYDKKTGKTLRIKAGSLADAKIYAEESIDFNDYEDGVKVDLFDWFWNYDYRHYLRDASVKQRNIVKQKFIEKGLELDGSSPKHAYIVVSTIKPSELKSFKKVGSDGIKYEKGGSIDDDLEKLEEVHEKIREILIENGSEEYGDFIIDEISEAVGISNTNAYYDEDEEYVKPKKVILKGTASEKDLENLEEVHEKIREILIENGNEEYGDSVIDKISEVVGIPTTIAYYDDDNDEDEYAGGGVAKKRKRSLSAQYGRSDREFDKQLTAKPVGYRFTNAKANQLRKDRYAKPTEAQVKKYLGKGIYKENRRNKSDRDRNEKI